MKKDKSINVTCQMLLVNGNDKKGYAALINVLIVGAVLVIILSSVPLLSISELQLSLAESKKERSLGLVEACVEEALVRLNEFNVLPSSVVLPEATCTVVTDSHVGNIWTFTVSVTKDLYTKKVQITAVRGGSTTITSWNEVQ